MPNIDKAKRLDALMKSSTLEERLNIISEFSVNAVFDTMFTRSDQYLLWAVYNTERSIVIIAPSSMELSAEQQTLLRITKERYGGDVVNQRADTQQLASFSVAALSDGLVTSRTRDSAEAGNPLPFVTWDHQRQAMIFNPLADMTIADVETAIFAHEIPVDLPENDHKLDAIPIQDYSAKQKGYWVVQEKLSALWSKRI